MDTMDFPKDEDGKALVSIAATGIDMSKPMPMRFAIASRDEHRSEAINQALASKGYDSRVYFDEGEPDFVEGDLPEFGPSWSVYVVVICAPSYDNVMKIQNELSSLVVPLGGKVDGWEVEIVR